MKMMMMMKMSSSSWPPKDGVELVGAGSSRLPFLSCFALVSPV